MADTDAIKVSLKPEHADAILGMIQGANGQQPPADMPPPEVGNKPMGALPRVGPPSEAGVNPAVAPAAPRSTASKVGHVLGTVGGLALSAVAPGIAAQIPQTPLGKIYAEKRANQNEEVQADIGQKKAAGESETSRAASEAKGAETVQIPVPWSEQPIQVEQKNVPAMQQAVERYNASIAGNQSKEKIGGEKNDTTKTVAGENNATKETVAQGKNATTLTVASGKNATAEDIAKEREEHKPEVGTWSIQEDPVTHQPVEFNSKTGQVRPATGVQARGTFDRQSQQQQKSVKPIQDVLDEIDESKELAATPSATNDYALLMNFIGITKPESIGKIRLNPQELKLATGTRSSLGDLEALGNKIANGQTFTSDQRKSILDTMDIIGKRAQSRMSEYGNQGAAGGGSKPNDPLGIR